MCVHVLLCGNRLQQCNIEEETLDLESRQLNLSPAPLPTVHRILENHLPSPVLSFFVSQIRCAADSFPKSLPSVKCLSVLDCSHRVRRYLIQLKHIVLTCLDLKKKKNGSELIQGNWVFSVILKKANLPWWLRIEAFWCKNSWPKVGVSSIHLHPFCITLSGENSPWHRNVCLLLLLMVFGTWVFTYPNL